MISSRKYNKLLLSAPSSPSPAHIDQAPQSSCPPPSNSRTQTNVRTIRRHLRLVCSEMLADCRWHSTLYASIASKWLLGLTAVCRKSKYTNTYNNFKYSEAENRAKGCGMGGQASLKAHETVSSSASPILVFVRLELKSFSSTKAASKTTTMAKPTAEGLRMVSATPTLSVSFKKPYTHEALYSYPYQIANHSFVLLSYRASSRIGLGRV